MTLKETFDKVIVYPFSENREQMKVLKEENSNECIKITDEFAIGFGEYLDSLLEEQIRSFTMKELLEIYKKGL